MTRGVRADRPEGLWEAWEVVWVTGCTYRQLDVWARDGLSSQEVVAAGSGSRRYWSTAQMVRVAVLSRLVQVFPGVRLGPLVGVLLQGGWVHGEGGVCVSVDVARIEAEVRLRLAELAGRTAAALR